MPFIFSSSVVRKSSYWGSFVGLSYQFVSNCDLIWIERICFLWVGFPMALFLFLGIRFGIVGSWFVCSTSLGLLVLVLVHVLIKINLILFVDLGKLTKTLPIIWKSFKIFEFVDLCRKLYEWQYQKCQIFKVYKKS